jgi:ABC-type multidrug transport system ATPase subunit
VPSALTKERADMLLKKVSMTDSQHRKIKTYSKGMKQRIGVAQALVSDPKIIFLDEPTMELILRGGCFKRSRE